MRPSHDGVDDDESGGHAPHRGDCLAQGVSEKDTAQAPALQRRVDGQPCQEYGRHLVRGAPARLRW
jgi:hypothetical protein